MGATAYADKEAIKAIINALEDVIYLMIEESINGMEVAGKVGLSDAAYRLLIRERRP